MDTDQLEWVSAEQQAQLDQLWEIRGDWREWLPVELDERWPQWREATPEELAQVLDGVLASLLLPADAVSVEDLGWLRDDQIAGLNQLWEIRGDWRQWLPAELDTAWAQWRQSTPEELAGWFDQVLPTLLLPQPDEPDEPDDGDRFGWVTAAQTAQLAEVYGDGWRDDLGRELDTRWGGGWEQNPAEHKQAWLDGLLPTLALPGAGLDNAADLLDDEAVRTEQLVFADGA